MRLKSESHLLVSSANVVPFIAMPESMLAELYTANRKSTQLLLGRRLGILKHVRSERRLRVFLLTYLLMLQLGVHVDFIHVGHKYLNWYNSGWNFGFVQISSAELNP